MRPSDYLLLAAQVFYSDFLLVPALEQLLILVDSLEFWKRYLLRVTGWLKRLEVTAAEWARKQATETNRRWFFYEEDGDGGGDHANSPNANSLTKNHVSRPPGGIRPAEDGTSGPHLPERFYGCAYKPDRVLHAAQVLRTTDQWWSDFRSHEKDQLEAIYSIERDPGALGAVFQAKDYVSSDARYLKAVEALERTKKKYQLVDEVRTRDLREEAFSNKGDVDELLFNRPEKVRGWVNFSGESVNHAGSMIDRHWQHIEDPDRAILQHLQSYDKHPRNGFYTPAGGSGTGGGWHGKGLKEVRDRCPPWRGRRRRVCVALGTARSYSRGPTPPGGS